MTPIESPDYSRFVRIPHEEYEALEEGYINRIMFDILGLIHRWCNFYTGVASSISAQRIADHLGYDEKPSLNTVRRYLRGLIDCGWIGWDYRAGITQRTYNVWLNNFPNEKSKISVGSHSGEPLGGATDMVLRPREIISWRQTAAYRGGHSGSVLEGDEDESKNQRKNCVTPDADAVPPAQPSVGGPAPTQDVPLKPQKTKTQKDIADDAQELADYLFAAEKLAFPPQNIAKALAYLKDYDVAEVERVLDDLIVLDKKADTRKRRDDMKTLNAFFRVGNMKTYISAYQQRVIYEAMNLLIKVDGKNFSFPAYAPDGICEDDAAARAIIINNKTQLPEEINISSYVANKLRETILARARLIAADDQKKDTEALAAMDRFISVNGSFPSSITASNEQIEVSPHGVFTHPKHGLSVVGLEANGRKHVFKISQALADQLRDDYFKTNNVKSVA